MSDWSLAGIERAYNEIHIKKDSNEISSDSDLFDSQLSLAKGF